MVSAALGAGRARSKHAYRLGALIIRPPVVGVEADNKGPGQQGTYADIREGAPNLYKNERGVNGEGRERGGEGRGGAERGGMREKSRKSSRRLARPLPLVSAPTASPGAMPKVS
eukprot:1191621-Prorocentrum_minimum.AAC.2